VRFAVSMKGIYCLLMVLEDDVSMSVGALGRLTFPRGVYAYVGSAQGGIEQRVKRHLGGTKKKRCHIDHLLTSARTTSVVSIPTGDMSSKCALASGLSTSPGARVVAKGFGSSGCRCESHLLHFEGDEYDDLLEMITGRIGMLCSPYPETVGSR
jgi:Uri superfamily endonuclease